MTIPAQGVLQYSGQLNDWDGSIADTVPGKLFCDSLLSLKAGEKYQLVVKKGLEIGWWECGEQDEIYDVVMWEIAQGGQPKKPKPVVLEVIRSEHDTFTMAD